jgi:hypothetical protein
LVRATPFRINALFSFRATICGWPSWNWFNPDPRRRIEASVVCPAAKKSNSAPRACAGRRAPCPRRPRRRIARCGPNHPCAGPAPAAVRNAAENDRRRWRSGPRPRQRILRPVHPGTWGVVNVQFLVPSACAVAHRQHHAAVRRGEGFQPGSDLRLACATLLSCFHTGPPTGWSFSKDSQDNRFASAPTAPVASAGRTLTVPPGIGETPFVCWPGFSRPFWYSHQFSPQARTGCQSRDHKQQATKAEEAEMGLSVGHPPFSHRFFPLGSY